MHLAKTLWDKLIKTVAYLINRSFDIKDIKSDELGHYDRPDLIHLNVVGSGK